MQPDHLTFPPECDLDEEERRESLCGLESRSPKPGEWMLALVLALPLGAEGDGYFEDQG